MPRRREDSRVKTTLKSVSLRQELNPRKRIRIKSGLKSKDPSPTGKKNSSEIFLSYSDQTKTNKHLALTNPLWLPQRRLSASYLLGAPQRSDT